MVQASKLAPIPVIPAIVWGFASLVGTTFATGTPVTTPVFIGHPTLVAAAAMIVGATFGLLAEMWANAMTGKNARRQRSRRRRARRQRDMKLQHTLGGLEGLDPITPEKRVFVEPWEKTIFGIHAAMMGLSNHLGFQGVPTKLEDEWTWADLRKGAEAMNPFDYFRFRYYEKWLGGISGWFTAKGYITAEELEAKTQEFLAATLRLASPPAAIPRSTSRSGTIW